MYAFGWYLLGFEIDLSHVAQIGTYRGLEIFWRAPRGGGGVDVLSHPYFFLGTRFFYKNNFIRTTRPKFAQKLRTS